MAPYKHIIWDWNGTLVDDAWLCVEVLNKLMADRGMITADLERYRRDFGFPVKDFYTALGFEFKTETFEQISVEYIEEYNRRRFECRLHSGAVDVLTAIQNAGIAQSVLSAYRQDYLDEALRHYGVFSFFLKSLGLDNIYAASKEENGKKWVQGLDVPKENILFVGDTTHDAMVAREMGVPCVLVDGGHQSVERLQKCGVPVMGSLGELWKMVKERKKEKILPQGR